MFESVFSDHLENDGWSAERQDETKRIGPYRLLERIGEGGFGEVFKAGQDRPVRRVVALKILKPGMDTRQVIARFEAERQALALMDHPGIARVFDAGATPEGRPYFVMEYACGEPLSVYCQLKNPSLVEKLGIFLQVCEAVHHAHQKGVIHRDLKPSNIIVTHEGSHGKPAVKLIDFGIARALSQTLTERTLLTRFHHVLGTPEYMSPEQAASGGVDVDVRSDVYSLGVVLYELLTGSTPFRETAGSSRISEAEVLRRQQDQDPPRPSTRLGERDGTPSADRHTLRKTQARELRGELDWIALKALSKERGRRYTSAGALAEDVRAYLEHRPVTARPPSAVYQFRKFARRHRAIAAGLVLAVGSLLTGTWVSWRMAVKAGTARGEAEKAQQRMREVYSQSDFRIAEELMAGDRASDAVAYLCRALRTQPENSAAATRLIATLASASTPQVLRAPLKHSTTVMGMRVTRDEKNIVTVCSDGNLWVWTRPFAPEPRLKLRFPNIEAMELSPDDRLIAGVSTNNFLTVWNLSSGAPLLQLHNALDGKDGRWPTVTFTNNGKLVVVANASGHIKAWTLPEGEPQWDIACPQQLRGPVGEAASLRATRLADCPDGSGRLAAGLSDARVAILDHHGSVITLLTVVREKQPNPITQLIWSPDGSRLAIGTLRGNVVLWDLAMNTAIGRTPRHAREVHTIRFNADGTRFATASYDNTARVFSARSGEALTEFLLHGDDLYDLTFSPDGQTLATASRDTLVRLWPWNQEAQSTHPIPLAHDRSPNAIVFAEGGKTLITSARDGLVRFWDLRRTLGPSATSQRLRQTLTPPKASRAGHFELAGTQLSATGVPVRAWQQAHEQPDKPWNQHAKGSAERLAVSGDGTVILSWEGPRVQAWKTGDGTAHGGELVLPDIVECAALSPHGDLAVLGLRNGTVSLLRPGENKPTLNRPAHRGTIHALLIGQDGKLAVSASDDGTARVWSLPDLTPRGESMRHSAAIRHLTLSDDGLRVATGSLDNSARLWSLRDGKPLTAPLRHGDRALEDTGILAAFTTDGRRLITTGSHDLTVRVWDCTKGAELITPLYINSHGRSIAVNADSSWFAVGDHSGGVHVWETATGRLLLHQTNSGAMEMLAFNPASSRLLGVRPGTTPIIWTLPRLNAPLPDWFLGFAESWFGRRFNAQDVLESVTFADFEHARSVAKQPPASSAPSVVAWARWLTSDPEDRALPP